MTDERFWIIETPDKDEPSLPEPASARGGAGPYLVPIVDEEYGGVIAWANTIEQAERIVSALGTGRDQVSESLPTLPLGESV